MNRLADRPSTTWVVEDHDLVRSLLTSWFASRGHRVRSCDPCDPDAFDEIAPDALVVLDLCLGRRNGVDVLQALADRHFSGAIILISSFPDAVIETARRVGIDFGLHVAGALSKPVPFDRLDALLDSIERPTSAPGSGSASAPRLGEALAEHRVTFHYQPILDARTFEVCSVEMLARLFDAAGRPISVAAVLADASAEDVRGLALLAIADAARLGFYLRSRGIDPLPTSINVPSSFIQRRHIGPVIDALDRAGPPLTFEVSELDSFGDLHEARRATTSAVLHGLRFSLDDFGTINSNIDRLVQLPFEEVKIDRAFVSGCADDPFRDAVCRSVVQLARLRGAVVVAEGVESFDDLDHLCELGVDRVQGYLFSRPLTAEAFADWILARACEDRSTATRGHEHDAGGEIQ